MTFCHPFLVDKMIGENWERSLHQLAQHFGTVAARHVGCNLLVCDVVWRGGCHFLFTVPPYHQMAIADTGKELDPVLAQFSRNVMDNRGSLFRRYMPGGEILHEGIAAVAARVTKLQRKRCPWVLVRLPCWLLRAVSDRYDRPLDRNP